jgi:hypothetical protein
METAGGNTTTGQQENLKKQTGLALEHLILNYLKDNNVRSASEAVSTLVIARYCLGQKATVKQINPSLYLLQKAKLVDKICEGNNGAKPRWFLCC